MGKKLSHLLSFVFCSSMLVAQPTVLNEVTSGQDTEKLNREGIDLADQRKYDDALGKFRKATAIHDKNSAKTYNNLGFAYQLKGDELRAIAAYRHAVTRDPNLIEPRQNLGKLLYDKGQYSEAIQHGERVMALDPRNTEVPKWLPDAYRRKTEERLNNLRENRREPVGGTSGGRNSEDDYASDYIFEVGYEFTGAMKLTKASSTFALHKQGGILRYPMNMWAKIRPSKKVVLDLWVGMPFLGSMQPSLISGRQKAQAIYDFGTLFVGAGLLFTQANLNFSNIPRKSDGDVVFRNNTDTSRASDVKLGLVFGMKSDFGKLTLAAYPRYLFRDTSSGPQTIEIDAAQVSLDFRSRPYYLGSKTNAKAFPLRYNFGIVVDEIYVMEYKVPSTGGTVSHWFGTYDINLGIEVNDLNPARKGFQWTAGFQFTERLYFRDTNNTNSLDFGNGQGYFGFSTSGSVKGNSFPSFASNTHIVSLFSRQLLFNRLFLRERIGYEISQNNDPFQTLLFDVSLATRF